MNEPIAAPARVDKLRVMLCHEVPLVRSGLRAIVNAENDMTVVGEAGNAEEAGPLLDQMKPEGIVSDLPIYGGGSRRGELADPYDVLSEREREILCLAATGHTNHEIAEILHLSKQTVHNVRARLMEKLGFHDRLELLRYALRRGIVSAESM